MLVYPDLSLILKEKSINSYHISYYLRDTPYSVNAKNVKYHFISITDGHPKFEALSVSRHWKLIGMIMEGFA